MDPNQFDISTLDPTTVFLIILPLLAAVGALLFFGWRREMNKRAASRLDRTLETAARAALPPPGAVELNLATRVTQIVDTSGRIMLVLVGTFGENVGDNLLWLLWRSGLWASIGTILVIESDIHRLTLFLQSLPEAFRQRVVTVEVPGFAGGLGNRSRGEVLSFIDRWGPAAIRGGHEVCELHQRLHRGEEAALGIVLIGMGATATVGTSAVEAICSVFRTIQFFGCAALPSIDRLRLQVIAILADYERVGVLGTIVEDNAADSVRNDVGLVHGIGGIIAASGLSDTPFEANNAFRQMFEESPGALVRFSTYAIALPGYRLEPTHPTVEPRYYVFKKAVDSKILTCLEHVKDPQFDSLGGVGDAHQVPLTSEIDVVLAALNPADLKANEDDVVLGLQLKGQSKRNHFLLFGSIGAEIDPARPLCPVVVVSFRAMEQPNTLLRALTEPVPATQLLNGRATRLTEEGERSDASNT